MPDLFDALADDHLSRGAPLAARMRPRSLDEIAGQDDVIGSGTALRHAIETDSLGSLILYGPAGSGKTSLARVIARVTAAHFSELSAVDAGVKEVRTILAQARERLALTGQRTILFIDEIHRFSKSQQDALLHAVEDRLVVLVGATTENPLFEVNAPLISRSRIVELAPLSDDAIRSIIERALTDERGLAGGVTLAEGVAERIATLAGGDARAALTTLELTAELASRDAEGSAVVDDEHLAALAGVRALPYDKDGDTHYDVISAFIKSMRGSDPDASIWWLARMAHSGEDAKFIARRMLIFASEDIGMADPRALLVAHAAFKAAESVGWPECRINLAHAAVYLALAPKSNAVITAIDAALAELRSGPARRVPDHLRDRHRPGSENYPPYVYPHEAPEGAAGQRYLPEGLERGRFWQPKDHDRDPGTA